MINCSLSCICMFQAIHINLLYIVWDSWMSWYRFKMHGYVYLGETRQNYFHIQSCILINPGNQFVMNEIKIALHFKRLTHQMQSNMHWQLLIDNNKTLVILRNTTIITEQFYCIFSPCTCTQIAVETATLIFFSNEQLW